MERADQRQDVENIMRRAEQLGHDPERVAAALGQRPTRPAEPPPVTQTRAHDSSIGARVAQRLWGAS